MAQSFQRPHEAHDLKRIGFHRRLTRLFLSTFLIVSLAGIGLPFSAQAVDSPLNKRCKSPALAAGLEWISPDPLYLQVKTNLRWQNCRGILRKVTVETRWMDYSGGLEDSETYTFTPDITQFKNRAEAKSVVTYLDGYWNVGFTSLKFQDDLQSCTKLVSGRETNELSGDTFYAVVTGYNKANKQILQLVTPPVACGQNG